MGVSTSRPSPCGDSLDSKHAELAGQLAANGFDAAAIARSAASFTDGRPAHYSEWSLPPNAVRVLALPLDAGLEAEAVPAGSLDPERVAAALQAVGLSTLVTADRSRWQPLEALMAVPWQAGHR